MIKFIFKNLFIHLLVLVLIDLPSPNVASFLGGVVFAAETSEEQLSKNLALYENLISHSQYPAVLSSAVGKKAMSEVQKFIGNKKNRSLLKRGRGRELLNLHNKLTRYNALKNKFDKCLNSKDARYTKGLPERLLAAGLELNDSEVPCNPNLFKASSLSELLSDLQGIIDVENVKPAKKLNDFEAKIGLQGLKNSARKYLKFEYTFNKSFGGGFSTLSPEPNKPNSAKPIVDEVCGKKKKKGRRLSMRPTKKCTKEEERAVQTAVMQEYRKLKLSESKRYSTVESRRNLIKRIDEINDVIKENEFDTQEHILSKDTINFNTKKSKESHQNYVQKYMAVGSDGPGLLLWTDEIGDSRKDKDRSAFFGLIKGGFNPETKRYRPHSIEISDDNIKEAIKELKGRVLGQSRYLRDKGTSRKNDWLSHVSAKKNPNYGKVATKRKKSLKEIITKNPVIAGQVLMQNPEYAQEACDVINGIIKDIKKGEEFGIGDMFVYAGIGVGVALLAATTFGLGALAVGAGAGALGATTLAAGAAAKATVVLTAAMYGGLALGTAEMIYFGPKWAKAHKEKNEFLNSYLAGGGDEKSAGDFLDKLAEMENARLHFLMAAGFALFDLGAMNTVMKGMSNLEKAKYLTKAKDIMNYIGKNANLSGKIKKVTSLMGRLGQSKIRRVLKMLARQDNYKEVLDHLRTLSPRELKKVLEKGFEVCEKLCK